MNAELGAKLGPKLAAAMANAYMVVKRQSAAHDAKVYARAITDATVAVRRQLASHDVKVRQMAIDRVIDRAGHEVADLYRPILRSALDDDTHDLHPLAREFLESAASGHEQYKAIMGLALGVGQSALSAVITNALWPVTSAINRHATAIPTDPATTAAGVAMGLVDPGFGLDVANGWGTINWAFEAMVSMAQQIPQAAELYDLVNRGEMSLADAEHWLHRAAIPTELHAKIMTLRHPLLTIADAGLANLKGVIDDTEARTIAEANGYTPRDLDVILGNTGEPPGTTDLLMAYRRGFIDRARLAHGIRQSRVRDEWIDVIERMRFIPMSTADAVDAAVQNHLDQEEAHRIAEQNGLEPDHFEILYETAGEPISRTELMDLWRRGEIDEQTVIQGIRESRVKDKYIHDVLKLKHGPITAIEAIDARVQNHISDQEARQVWQENGLDPQFYDVLLRTAGSPLSLTEALTLHRRGLMTRDEVIQDLRETRLKDKYIDQALELSRKIPELYEIRQMLKTGTITDAEATRLLAEDGYDEHVIRAIIKSSVKTIVAASKHITVGVIDQLYMEKAITASEYDQHVITLGVTKADAELMRHALDLRIEVAARHQEISAIRAAYVARHIEEHEAGGLLDALVMNAEQRDALIRAWDIEREIKRRELTEAQVVAAWKLDLFDQADQRNNYDLARDELIGLGYSADHAKMLLELGAKGVIDVGGLSSAPGATASSSQQ